MWFRKSYVSTASSCESEHVNRCLILQEPPKLLPVPLPSSRKREFSHPESLRREPSIPRPSRSLNRIRRLLGLDAHTPSGFWSTDSPQRTSVSLHTSGAFVIYECPLLPPNTETVRRTERFARSLPWTFWRWNRTERQWERAITM